MFKKKEVNLTQLEKLSKEQQDALGEINHLGRLVDQHKAERDEAVDATLGQAADDELNDFQGSPNALGTAACTAVLT